MNEALWLAVGSVIGALVVVFCGMWLYAQVMGWKNRKRRY